MANEKSYSLLARAMYFTVFVLLNVARSVETLDANGLNVCNKKISYSQTYKQSYQYAKKVSYKTSCGLWGWGRCTRYRTVYGTSYRHARRRAYKTAYECCKGWKPVGNECLNAICSQACVNGTCIRPDYCSCYAGYYGKLCDRDCPSHKWGSQCKHDCLCKNNAKCSPHNGSCTCTPGWEGQYCGKPCAQGYYGNNCQNACQCQNGSYCDVVSGNCTCAPGYHGLRCELSCPTGFYGQDCAFKCACSEGVSCGHVNGTCNCTAGWTGDQCADQKSLCDTHHCMHGASCDHVTGTCQCTSGWTGDICSQKCPDGTYGYRCEQECLNCMHGATCHHVTGRCLCKPGYTGKRCQDLCQEGTYGLKCLKKCACQNNAKCSPIDGFCNCSSWFTGVHCEKQCSENTGRQDCEDKDKTQYDKHYEEGVTSVLPIVLGVLSFFIMVAAAIAIGCFIRCKRSKRMHVSNETVDHTYAQPTSVTAQGVCSNGDEAGIYQTPSNLPLNSINTGSNLAASRLYAEPTSPATSSATATSSSTPTVTSSAPKNHIYESPSVRPMCTSACDDVCVSNSKATSKYMALHKTNINIYEPMSPVTRNKIGFPVGELDKRSGDSSACIESNNTASESTDYQELQFGNADDYEHLCAVTSLPPEEEPSDQD